MFLSILYVIILPIILGFVVHHYFERFAECAVLYLPAFSSVAICLIVGCVVSANASKLLTGGLLIIAVVVLHNLFGLTLGYSVARLLGLVWKKRVAISIEVGMQNSGLASSLATVHFAMYPMATVPGAIFSVWHNLSGALVAKFYSKHSEQHAE